MRDFRFIDVSGVGNAGKGAVVDFLREIDGFFVPEHMFEFDLFRIPGGLLDLEYHLVRDWSLIRADRAVKEFKNIALRMGLNPKWYDLRGRLKASGQRYDRYFNGKFLEYLEDFTDSLVAGEFRAQWYHDWMVWNPLRMGFYKFLLKAGSTEWVRSPVYITDRVKDSFPQRTSRLINQLFSEIVTEQTTHIVFNNAFEPFNPERGLNLLRNSKIIIVYRDPRDVFVSGLSKKNWDASNRDIQADENDGVNKSFLGSDNLEIFVLRFRTMMENLYREADSRVLLVRFEEFVNDFDRLKSRVLRFLEVESSAHIHPHKYFIPSKSRANIGLWQKYSRKKEIDFISGTLPEYIWKEP